MDAECAVNLIGGSILELYQSTIHILHGLDHWSLLEEWGEFRFYLFSFKKTVFSKVVVRRQKVVVVNVSNLPSAQGETNELTSKPMRFTTIEIPSLRKN